MTGAEHRELDASVAVAAFGWQWWSVLQVEGIELAAPWPPADQTRWNWPNTAKLLGDTDGGCRRFTDWWSVGPLPRYSSAWEAGGPLVERYRLCVQPAITSGGDFDWQVHSVTPRMTTLIARGPTPLVAICRCVVAIAEAKGKA